MYELNANNSESFEKASGVKISNLYDEIHKLRVNVLTLDNFIDNENLNNLGLQIYRCLAFDQKFNENRKNCDLYNTDYHEQLINHGFVKIENALDVQQLEKVKNFIKSLDFKTVMHKKSFDLNFHTDVSSNDVLQQIFRLSQGNNSFKLDSMYLRKVYHDQFTEQDEDLRQYNFHVDKFYPNYKVWLYPMDITEATGPLAFFKGSHKNTIKKLQWFKQKSLNKDCWGKTWSRLHYNVEDFEEPAKSLGFAEHIKCIGNANTAFVVDTRMFHRRTPAKKGSLRFSLRAILPREDIF